jgi:hypothetical protein
MRQRRKQRRGSGAEDGVRTVPTLSSPRPGLPEVASDPVSCPIAGAILCIPDS